MRAEIFLRSTLFILSQALLTVAFSVYALMLLPLPRILRYKQIRLWNRSLIASLRWICGIRHDIAGTENLPEPPYVIVSNHQSAWETIAFSCIFPPCSFVAKRELLWIPCFGWGLAAMSPITIKRQEPASALRSLLTTGRERLRQGMCVCVFPEGTRIQPGRTADFSPGGFVLARKAGLPVVPVAHNSGLLWGRNAWTKKPGLITVSIGKPIRAAKSARVISALAREWIASETRRLECRPPTVGGAGAADNRL